MYKKKISLEFIQRVKKKHSFQEQRLFPNLNYH